MLTFWGFKGVCGALSLAFCVVDLRFEYIILCGRIELDGGGRWMAKNYYYRGTFTGRNGILSPCVIQKSA